MGAVLCHGVLAWSCPRCRLMFFDGPKRQQLLASVGAQAATPLGPWLVRAPERLRVATARVKPSTHQLRDAFGVILLATLVVGVMWFELRPA
jgi:hypothetical protein